MLMYAFIKKLHAHWTYNINALSLFFNEYIAIHKYKST